MKLISGREQTNFPGHSSHFNVFCFLFSSDKGDKYEKEIKAFKHPKHYHKYFQDTLKRTLLLKRLKENKTSSAGVIAILFYLLLSVLITYKVVSNFCNEKINKYTIWDG